MGIDTRFDSKTGIFWLVLEGEIDFAEVMQTLTDLYTTEAYPRRIWDVRRSRSHFSRDEMATLAAALRHLGRNRRVRSALLTATDLQFGLSRSLQPRLGGGGVSLGVFKTEEEAVAWVSTPPAREEAGS